MQKHGDFSSKTWPQLIWSPIIGLLELIPFQLHDGIISSFVPKSLTSYGQFSDLGVEVALGHCHIEKR